MTDTSQPALPSGSTESIPKHSARPWFRRFRRAHLVAAGGVVAVLAAGGVAWAAMGGSPESPEATGGGATQPPHSSSPESGDPGAPASPAAGQYPVPTWGPPQGGRPGRRGDRPDRRVPGLPSDLSADRDGDTVVLRWTDNTNNEDGFAVFVRQGPARFQIVVPAGTTRHVVASPERDELTCFAVVPFTWSQPVTGYPTRGWECTERTRS